MLLAPAPHCMFHGANVGSGGEKEEVPGVLGQGGGGEVGSKQDLSRKCTHQILFPIFWPSPLQGQIKLVQDR